MRTTRIDRPRVATRNAQYGLTLIELLVTLAIAGIIMASLTNLLGESLQTEILTRQKNALVREAEFAMARMTRAVGKTRYLMIPLAENPSTAWKESVRDVLAVTLDPTLDRDRDGWADANNDKDFQDLNQNGIRDAGEWERIDEDSHSDMNNDGSSGISGIDDDGDGSIDEHGKDDDDEDGANNEEQDGELDLDGDFALGEDKHQQMVHDDKPGIAGVDDDADGTVDEGDKNDDDEDGVKNEDWLDAVVYYLNGTDLIERMPAIDPVDGTDYTETVLAGNVSNFQVTRYSRAGSRAVLVNIAITISASGGESYTLNAMAAQGGLL